MACHKDSLDIKAENKQITIETDISKQKAPDGGWGWFVVLGSLLLRIIVGGIQRSSGLFYVKFLEKFNGTATQTAWVTSLSMTVRLLIGPLVSVLCNRFSRRKLSYFGAAIYVIALHVSAYATSLPYLYFSYGVLGGFGRSFLLTPCTLLLGEYFDKRRSVAFGLASAGFGIGGFAITPFVELLFQEYGFTGTYIMLSGIACHLFICVAFFRSVHSVLKEVDIKERKKKKNIYKDPVDITKGSYDTDVLKSMISSTGSIHIIKETLVDHSSVAEVDEELPATKDKLKNNDDSNQNNNTKELNKAKKKLFSFSVFKDIRFMTLCCATFIFTLPSVGLFLPALGKSRGLTDIQTAYLLSIIAGCDTVSRVISGFLMDMKKVRSFRPYVYNGVSFVQCIAVFVIPSARDFTDFVAICCLHGIVMGVKAAQRNVVLMDILGVDKLSSSFAVLLVFQGVGTLIGPPVAGLLKDTYGKYDYSFYFGGTAILSGATILLFGNLCNLRNTRKKKRDDTAASTEPH